MEHSGHDHGTHFNHPQTVEVNSDNVDVEISSAGHETRFSEDINIRAAFIHVLGDLVQSVGVLIASGIIWYNNDWRIADPICTLLFSVIVIISTYFISRDIFRILMEGTNKSLYNHFAISVGTPKNVTVANILEDLKCVEGVLGAHDLHVWAISSNNIALTVHITIDFKKTSSCHDEILSKVQEMLCLKYAIHHSTIQLENKESIHCNPKYCVQNEIQ